MNYASLVVQIQQYANRTDDFFTNQIPNLILQAINRIYSEAKSLGFISFVENSTLTSNTNYITKPVDWKETISFVIINGNQQVLLLPRSIEFGQTYWPNSALTGTPQFYADLDNSYFYFFPTPDQGYTYNLLYRTTVPFSLGNANQDLINFIDNPNFLVQRYPSLLLYACMMEAIPFLKDDERVPVFESFYNRALQNINKDQQITITDRTSKRDAN